MPDNSTDLHSDFGFSHGQTLAAVLRVVEIEKPGMLTTIQDLPGRTGLWEVGVPPSGPMDPRSCAHANPLVGNDPGTAALEATLEGPTFRIPGGGVIAVSGADAPITIDGQPAPSDQAITVAPGSAFARSIAPVTRANARSSITAPMKFEKSVTGPIDRPSTVAARSSRSTFQSDRGT